MSRRERARRGFGLALCLAAIAWGLTIGREAGDRRWLALLGLAGLGLLVALWPRLPRGRPLRRGAPNTLRAATVILSLFVLLAAQLLRIQVVVGNDISQRVARAPNGEIVANPRRQGMGLLVHRGRILARDGTVLAESQREGPIWRRVYPAPAAYDVVGYYAPLQYGTAGLEASYDRELSGQAAGGLTRWLDGLLHRQPPGDDLVLTLDPALQQQAHDLLNGRPGAVVLLDARTGAVLALASEPGIDPNRLFAATPDERAAAAEYWQSLMAAADRPLVTRATLGLFTPGSTFKTVTAGAAIDSGITNPAAIYGDAGWLEVEGHTIVEENRPDPSRDTWTLADGLAYSLNVVFAQVGLQLGAERLTAYATRFGFGSAPPFDLPVTTSRLADSPDFLNSRTALADTAFGQGQLQATPLEMALVAACYANGGTIMRPYLVQRVVAPDGATRREAQPAVWRRPVSAATAEQVRAMMVGAVEHGYVEGAQIPGLAVGGKTGTAEVGDGPPHAWFIGFVGEPAEAPRYAVAVVLEHGGAGLAGSLAIGRAMLAAMGQSAAGSGGPAAAPGRAEFGRAMPPQTVIEAAYVRAAIGAARLRRKPGSGSIRHARIGGKPRPAPPAPPVRPPG